MSLKVSISLLISHFSEPLSYRYVYFVYVVKSLNILMHNVNLLHEYAPLNFLPTTRLCIIFQMVVTGCDIQVNFFFFFRNFSNTFPSSLTWSFTLLSSLYTSFIPSTSRQRTELSYEVAETEKFIFSISAGTVQHF